MPGINNSDTIAAIATPMGKGAIGVIRVSGKEAIEKVNTLFEGKDLAQEKGYTVHFGKLKTGHEILDEVLVTLFRTPKSYTGEDVVEISCHGSGLVLNKVMEVLLDLGIRHAGPGEFTMRAFMNGKMDLSQAEGVADLIASESVSSRNAALNQMRGGFSKKIKALRERLLNLASMLELELDFAEEDVEFADRIELKTLLNELEQELSRLADSFQLGNVIKNGVSVVIAGRPNAGKSTLLNALLEDEKAIVSEIPGTTRDVIEDVIQLNGILFRFIDTAGIRTSEDTIEKMGIARTMQKMEKADIIIYLFDVSEVTVDDVTHDLQKLPANKPFIVAANKIDQANDFSVKTSFSGIIDIIFLSSLTGENLDQLKEKLLEKFEIDESIQSGEVVTNLRHYEALKAALNSVKEIQSAFEQNVTTDLIAIDIRRALNALGEITGQITTDEILGNIFSKFCIGK